MTACCSELHSTGPSQVTSSVSRTLLSNLLFVQLVIFSLAFLPAQDFFSFAQKYEVR